MKTKLSLILIVLTLQVAWSQNRDKISETPVILSHDGTRTHLTETFEPQAQFFGNGALQIMLSSEHYSSYTIRLTPGNGGSDIVVAATSATVSIPVVDASTDYVVTVDGGDYGTYDGLLSPSNGSTITLNDMQAMQLVKNRRANNADVHFYSATVNSVIGVTQALEQYIVEGEQTVTYEYEQYPFWALCIDAN